MNGRIDATAQFIALLRAYVFSQILVDLKALDALSVFLCLLRAFHVRMTEFGFQLTVDRRLRDVKVAFHSTK